MTLSRMRIALLRFDPLLAKVELALSAACLAALMVFMAIGTVTRSLGHPLVFSDDLSITLMVWAALFSISANLARDGHMKVDMLWRHLPDAGKRAVDFVIFALVLGFVISLWRWLDPVGLIRAGDPMALAMATGNYAYSEPAMTLGILKIWLWAPMVPAGLFALFHSVMRLLAQREAAR